MKSFKFFQRDSVTILQLKRYHELLFRAYIIHNGFLPQVFVTEHLTELSNVVDGFIDDGLLTTFNEIRSYYRVRDEARVNGLLVTFNEVRGYEDISDEEHNQIMYMVEFGIGAWGEYIVR